MSRIASTADGVTASRRAWAHGLLDRQTADVEAVYAASIIQIFAGTVVAGSPITKDGINGCGGRLVKWNDKSEIALFGRQEVRDGLVSAIVLLQPTGIPFPATERLGERKTHTVGGSVNSWLCSGDPTTATVGLEVEGVSDLLAVASVGLPAGYAAVTNTAGAKAHGKLPREWARGKRIIIAGDADEPGQEGMKRSAAAYHQAGAAEVRLAQLPYPIAKDHGKDLRDWLNEGHVVAELPTVATTARDGEEEEPGRVKTLADEICLQEHFRGTLGGRCTAIRPASIAPMVQTTSRPASRPFSPNGGKRNIGVPALQVRWSNFSGSIARNCRAGRDMT